ncbi:hypothetical protein DSM112329_00367 [Paraconexibacter sp. AEG42_29]|uniref:Mce/MlaD domain-containing protein n=1 Tax=Paraconexibacter sp. AEG42_29 TaxID=2997339 RepID=A0AAU7APF1_9ACTN
MSRTTPMRRTRRRRTDTPTKRSVAVKGFATMGVIFAFIALAVTANKGVPGRDYTKMFVAAPEIGSLRYHDRVAIGGVRVGQVAAVTPGDKGGRVELQLEPGVTLPSDTTVRIRANGLLGARYVQLIPGSAGDMLGDGATIRGDKNSLTATVPDALDVFNKETRGALGTAVTGLGRGLLGNGEPLNDGIRVASDATVPFRGIMQSILDREGAAGRLAPSLNSMMEPLAGVSPQLAAMLRPGADALRPFADRREDLRTTLDVAPGAMRTATGGLNAGTRLLAAAGNLSRAAHRTLPSAPRGLREASALLRKAHAEDDGGTPLERATSLLQTAEPTVPKVLDVTRSLKPVLPRLNEAIGELTPMVRYLGPYGCDIINTGVVLRSMTGFVGTGTGPNGPSSQFRLQALAGVEAIGLKDTKSLKTAYHPPCQYLGHDFVVTPLTNLGKGR